MLVESVAASKSSTFLLVGIRILCVNTSTVQNFMQLDSVG